MFLLVMLRLVVGSDIWPAAPSQMSEAGAWSSYHWETLAWMWSENTTKVKIILSSSAILLRTKFWNCSYGTLILANSCSTPRPFFNITCHNPPLFNMQYWMLGRWGTDLSPSGGSGWAAPTAWTFTGEIVLGDGEQMLFLLLSLLPLLQLSLMTQQFTLVHHLTHTEIFIVDKKKLVARLL